jgi:hypothetical protein
MFISMRLLRESKVRTKEDSLDKKNRREIIMAKENDDKVDNEAQRLKDSIDAFFDKKDVDVRDRYHIVYDLSMDYHDEIMQEADEEEEADAPEEEEVVDEQPAEEEGFEAEEEVGEQPVEEFEDLEAPEPPEDERVPRRVPPLNLPKKPAQRPMQPARRPTQGHEASMKSKLQSMPSKQLPPQKGKAPLVKRPVVKVRE